MKGHQARLFRALRWLLWLFMVWVFIRGLVSFFPTPLASSQLVAGATGVSQQDPSGLHSFPPLFVREYLTWTAGHPDEQASRLQPFVAREVALQTGWGDTAREFSQEVVETWVHESRSVSPSRWLVTVAATVRTYRTAPTGAPGGAEQRLSKKTLYIAVPIARIAEGGWVVYDYPTLVPPPPAGEFTEPLHYGREVPDEGGQVKTLLTRFFPAYLSGNTTDLAYYLTPEARVRAFRSPWTFDSVTEVILSQTESGLYALAQVVLVDPATGARYTNRYTTGLVKRDGRWYVNEILQKGE